MLEHLLKRFRLRVQSIHEVEDSFSSTVYRCRLLGGEALYLKIPYNKIKFQRELEAYEILEDRVATPKMLDYWDGDEVCAGAFLLSELKGSPLTTEASSNVAFQIGVLHASMHDIMPPENRDLFGMKNEFPNWSSFIENQFYSFAEDVKGTLDEQLYHLAIEKFEKMKQQLPSPDGPSFIHMDFRPANIIVNKGNVSGVLDFESVRFGSTEIDFTKLYRDFLDEDSRLSKAYQEGYKSIRPLIDLEAVLPFYRFADAFNSIGWCNRRGTEKNAAFLEENMKKLREFVL
ncbi:phosphotransferase family protein [Oceanobacillus kapialis]|uniref:Phosphotransferase family protein n=1 Tax=Oceanobacillus kapialis TaxID=481353 RepID=A0ABW5PZH3_9BACI